jgi:hypothetical protein
LFDLLVSVNARIDSLEEKFDGKTKELERRLELLESTPTAPGSSSPGGGDNAQASEAPRTQMRQEVFSEVISEMKDIEMRRTNIIMFGVKESTSESIEERKQHDEDEITGVFRAVGPNPSIDLNVKAFFRVGKPFQATNGASSPESRPRPLKVILDNEEAKREILSCASRLMNSAFNRVYVKPDLTKHQREERNRMLAQRKNGRTSQPSESSVPEVASATGPSPGNPREAPRTSRISFPPKNGSGGRHAR